MRYRLIYALFTALLLSSCASTKNFEVVKIPKDKVVAQMIKTDVNDGYGLSKYGIELSKTKEATDASILIEKSKITFDIFTPEFLTKLDTLSIDQDDFLEESVYRIPYTLEYGGLISSKHDPFAHGAMIYYPQDTIGVRYMVGERFAYRTKKWVTQAMSIPFKIRPSQDEDDRPYELTTGVNVGFAISHKWNWHRVRPIFNMDAIDKELVGNRQSSWSLAPGLFVGLTKVDLKKTNTKPAIENDRSVLGFNGGLMLNAGRNKVNIGAAIGWDAATGSDAGKWVYKSKPWFGLVLGLDLIK